MSHDCAEFVPNATPSVANFAAKSGQSSGIFTWSFANFPAQFCSIGNVPCTCAWIRL